MSATTIDAEDDEIIEIFAEEAGEVLANIEQHLASLRTRPADRNALGEVRRGFHTLKGSGRMVKALDLGELAWKVENMLNRAIEGKIPVNEHMVSLVAACSGAMPRLVDAFRGNRKPGMEEELESLMGQADAIASGQGPAAVAPKPAQPPAQAQAQATSGGDAASALARINELYRRFERSAQRADEALHRSEMALQQVRRLAARIDASAAEAQDRPTRTEINPLIERVNALTREILELRQASKGAAQPESGLANSRELMQLVDQRIRERLAPVERSRSELERQLEEARAAVAAARSLGLGALVLGALLAIGLGVALFKLF